MTGGRDQRTSPVWWDRLEHSSWGKNISNKISWNRKTPGHIAVRMTRTKNDLEWK